MSDDLISRQAAIDLIANATVHLTIGGRRGFQNYKEEVEKVFVAIRDKYIEALKALPSAQPEIIRCKDCKHLFDGEHNANCCEVLMEKAKWLIEITVDMNWSCADGKRRTDAT